MSGIPGSKRFALAALVVAIALLDGCSNPPGRSPDPGAERALDAAPTAFLLDVALDDITRVVEPTWAADAPAQDVPAPAPRDWLKNLVGSGGKTDPGAPSP